MKKALRFFILFLFVASLTLTIGRLDSNIVEIPDTPKPDYLESYIDPAFGTKVTRITGDPGTAIPDVYGVWGNIARHHYSYSILRERLGALVTTLFRDTKWSAGSGGTDGPRYVDRLEDEISATRVAG